MLPLVAGRHVVGKVNICVREWSKLYVMAVFDYWPAVDVKINNAVVAFVHPELLCCDENDAAFDTSYM